MNSILSSNFQQKIENYLAVAATRAVADLPTAWPADAASSELDLSLISSRTSSIDRRAIAVDDDDDDDEGIFSIDLLKFGKSGGLDQISVSWLRR